MKEAISAYRSVTATDKFKVLERERHYAELNRVTDLKHARSEEREKWEGEVAKIVAEKDALIAKLQAQLAEAKGEGE